VLRRMARTLMVAIGLLSVLTPRGLAGQHSARRDSAGVAIITSRSPRWGPSEGWVLADHPTVRIGGFDQELWQMRSHLLTPDGMIVVLSAGTSRVHVFDGSGRALASFGRRGGGPGEFEFPTHLAFVRPDTVLVLDRHSIEVFLLF